jgi:hypothetical protein
VENTFEAHILAARALLHLEERFRKVGGEAFFILDGVRMLYFDFARKFYGFAGHPTKEEDIQVVPYWVLWSFAALSGWFYWVFTFWRTTPEVGRLGIEYLGGGCEWDICKAKERFGMFLLLIRMMC